MCEGEENISQWLLTCGPAAEACFSSGAVLLTLLHCFQSSPVCVYCRRPRRSVFSHAHSRSVKNLRCVIHVCTTWRIDFFLFSLVCVGLCMYFTNVTYELSHSTCMCWPSAVYSWASCVWACAVSVFEPHSVAQCLLLLPLAVAFPSYCCRMWALLL